MLHELVAIVMLAIGLSHVLWAGRWADAALGWTRSRHPATTGMISGIVALAIGAAILLARPSTDGLLIITTVIGWIAAIRGVAWLLLPGIMLSLIPRTRSALTVGVVLGGLIQMAAGGALLFATSGLPTSG